MVLADKRINLFNNKLINPFDPSRVQNICYDLTAVEYYNAPGDVTDSSTLAPGDSVFVRSREKITLPNNIIGIVNLRNSRLRQGLELSAPVYQPGHDTPVYFRVTNISHKAISLASGDGIASIMFVEVTDDVDKPYDGTFQNEFDFTGMGAYTSSLSKQMTNIEEKVNDIKTIEKDIYGNILALMAIFVAIFSLVNVNVSLVAQSVTEKMLLTLNFATVTSVGFLIAIINTILPSGKYRKIVWLVCGIAFFATILIQFVL